MENLGQIARGNLYENIDFKSRIGFYDYYQILFDDDDNHDESEEFGASGKRGLKGRMDGLHSPFGTLGKIKAERGYTHAHVLWGETWLNLLMESADAPRYTKKQHIPVVDGANELKERLGR